jgi:hypothetical protein
MSSTTFEVNEWTTDLENILDKIRLNSTVLTEYHKERYYKYKGYLKYFKVPTIIFSAFSSVFSVGLQSYVEQNIVSIITCLIGLFVGILNSLELFLAIAQTMDSELTHSRDFYLLAVDICKTLMLQREHRLTAGKQYLNEKYSVYCKLVENSILVDKILTDKLLPINEIIQYEIQNLLNNKTSPTDNNRDRWKRAIREIRGTPALPNVTPVALPTLYASVTTTTTNPVASLTDGPMPMHMPELFSLENKTT